MNFLKTWFRTGFCAALLFQIVTQICTFLITGRGLPLAQWPGVIIVFTLVFGLILSVVHLKRPFKVSSCIWTGVIMIAAFSIVFILALNPPALPLLAYPVLAVYGVAIGVGGYIGAPRALKG